MMKWTGPSYKPKVIEAPYRAINKKMRRILLATLLLILVCAIVSILFIRHAVSQQNPDVYVVQKGDTLWDICKEIYGDMKDTREMVYRMMKLNGIEDPGKLQPGMKIYLPVVVD